MFTLIRKTPTLTWLEIAAPSLVRKEEVAESKRYQLWLWNTGAGANLNLCLPCTVQWYQDFGIKKYWIQCKCKTKPWYKLNVLLFEGSKIYLHTMVLFLAGNFNFIVLSYSPNIRPSFTLDKALPTMSKYGSSSINVGTLTPYSLISPFRLIEGAGFSC